MSKLEEEYEAQLAFWKSAALLAEQKTEPQFVEVLNKVRVSFEGGIEYWKKRAYAAELTARKLRRALHQKIPPVPGSIEARIVHAEDQVQRLCQMVILINGLKMKTSGFLGEESLSDLVDRAVEAVSELLDEQRDREDLKIEGI